MASLPKRRPPSQAHSELRGKLKAAKEARNGGQVSLEGRPEFLGHKSLGTTNFSAKERKRPLIPGTFPSLSGHGATPSPRTLDT